jgi:hypothetical protein
MANIRYPRLQSMEVIFPPPEINPKPQSGYFILNPSPALKYSTCIHSGGYQPIINRNDKQQYATVLNLIILKGHKILFYEYANFKLKHKKSPTFGWNYMIPYPNINLTYTDISECPIDSLQGLLMNYRGLRMDDPNILMCISPTNQSKYGDFVKVLDEMRLCGIKRYISRDLRPYELAAIQNWNK